MTFFTSDKDDVSLHQPCKHYPFSLYLTISNTGLPTLTPNIHAFLIPFRNNVQYAKKPTILEEKKNLEIGTSLKVQTSKADIYFGFIKPSEICFSSK